MSALSIRNMNHSQRNQRDMQDLGDVLTQAEKDAIRSEVEMSLARSQARQIAGEIAAWNQLAGLEYLEKLENEKGDLLAAYFCDPRTPAQIEADELDRETRETHESAR